MNFIQPETLWDTETHVITNEMSALDHREIYKLTPIPERDVQVVKRRPYRYATWVPTRGADYVPHLRTEAAFVSLNAPRCGGCGRRHRMETETHVGLWRLIAEIIQVGALIRVTGDAWIYKELQTPTYIHTCVQIRVQPAANVRRDSEKPRKRWSEIV